MHKFLWVVQILLALHTVMGAMWKLSNSEQTVPSLAVIPHGVWLALGALEVICAVGLVLPAFNQRFAKFMPLAALGIAAEMLVFCAIQLSSGEPNVGEVTYWGVVAGISVFLAYARLKLSPLPQHLA